MQVFTRPDLAKRTTIGIGGRALLEIILEKPKDFEEAFVLADREGGRVFVLGAGSNMLFADGQLDLLLLRCWTGGVKIVREWDDRVVVRAGGGMRLARLLGWAVKHGLSGLEGLVGIPGSVGGAVAMNAGSHGVEVGDLLYRVEIMHRETGLTWLGSGSFQAEYRGLLFPGLPPGPLIISSAEIILRKTNPLEVKRTITECYKKKKAAQPILSKTCGCVFKNPSGYFAGQLLDECGLKGMVLGEMCFSSKHANFLVNSGRGTFVQAGELINLARQRVKEEFGVDLQLEVRVVQ